MSRKVNFKSIPADGRNPNPLDDDPTGTAGRSSDPLDDFDTEDEMVKDSSITKE